ncbi:hypothetical protein [Halorussus pelagicus]|uniref:hypothetical protein n=1 Tax=Halorussus pelagicus TaxID=2505977 RepID=UPI000FFB10E0|nr:hypothetical protein [Halorussus pelagicus]
MARDDTAGDSDSLLDRRSYVKLAGAAAATVGAAGVSSSSADAASGDGTEVVPNTHRVADGDRETPVSESDAVTADGARDASDSQ